MVNSEQKSNLSSEDVKCFLIEQFGHNIKFSESERKNESQFVLLLATEVEDVINSLHNIKLVKNADEAIKERLLQVDYNVDGSFVAHKIPNNLGNKQKYLVLLCPEQSRIYTR